MGAIKKLNRTTLLFILIFLLGLISFVIYINSSFINSNVQQTTATAIEVTQIPTS
jgi:hypothetical protein